MLKGSETVWQDFKCLLFADFIFFFFEVSIVVIISIIKKNNNKILITLMFHWKFGILEDFIDSVVKTQI